MVELSWSSLLKTTSVILPEIPDNVKEGLEIKAVKSIDEILPLALTSMPEPLVKAPIVKAVDEGKKAARH